MQPLSARPPDYTQFLKVLWRRERPAHLPFYEHIASPGFISARLGVPRSQLTWANPDYPRLFAQFWLGMGFDVVPMEIAPRFTLPAPAQHGLSLESEATAVIFTREDFDKYPWPDEASPIPFQYFEAVARCLPEGARIVGGVCAGPFEWVSRLMGYQGMSLALATDPDLFRAMFEKVGALHVSAVRHLADMDSIVALRQGDDLGFKTSTFLPPDVLRTHVFPIYRRMVQEAHARNKPFILHSCGNLSQVYEDLISECGIDAKHSFEDTILPVAEFKKTYGRRVTPLGGLDVDFICRESEAAIRAYTRRAIQECFSDGFWALGTGNSLTDYMPVASYLAVLDEGLKTGRG